MFHAKYLAEIGSVVEKEKMASHQEKEKVIYLEHIPLLQLIIKRKNTASVTHTFMLCI